MSAGLRPADSLNHLEASLEILFRFTPLGSRSSTGNSCLKGEESALKSAPKKITFNFTFRNVGKTPTTGLFIKARIANEAEGLPLADGYCVDGNNIANSRIDVGFHNFSIIPQDAFSSTKITGQEDFANISIEEIIKFNGPTIIGCVTYQTRFDQQLHHTEFIAPIVLEYGNVCVNNVFTFKPT